MLGLLEAGAYDYLYIYKSVAKQHGLKYITLPPEVSLKSKKYSDFYKNATFKITGKKEKWLRKNGQNYKDEYFLQSDMSTAIME